MIYFYSGTPGSGKSLHVAREIKTRLMFKQSVISNMYINVELLTRGGKKEVGKFTYLETFEITPEFLYQYAYENHYRGKEGQTLVIIDECQLIFNPREFSRKDRLTWINFFTHHRHLGYDFILVSQFDRLIDRQIRCLFEYEIKHRKVNNFGLLWLFPVKVFVAITSWYGVHHIKSGSEFFLYNKKIGALYNSFALFDFFKDENAPADQHEDVQPEDLTSSAPDNSIPDVELITASENDSNLDDIDEQVQYWESVPKEEILAQLYPLTIDG